MKLIDADELIKKIRHDDKDGIYWEIYHAPTIEAEPVRHGKWIVKRNPYIYQVFDKIHVCSECHTAFPIQTPYCGECGAKMDEVEE